MRLGITFFGIIVSAACLYFVFKDIHFTEMSHVIRGADGWLLVCGAIIKTLGFAIRGAQWRSIVHCVKTGIPFTRLFTYLMVGIFYNTVLPFKAGEVIRGYLLSRKENIPLTSALTTVGLIRVFDLIALGLFALGLCTYFFFFEFQNKAIFQEVFHTFWTNENMPGTPAIGLLILAIALAISFLLRISWFRHISKKIWMPMASAFSIFNSKQRFSVTLVYAILFWLNACLVGFCILKSLHISLDLPIIILLILAVAVGISVPGVPGYIGPFHLAVTFVLQKAGVPAETAVSAAVVWHAIYLLTTIGLGGIYSFKTQIKWNAFP